MIGRIATVKYREGVVGVLTKENILKMLLEIERERDGDIVSLKQYLEFVLEKLDEVENE